IVSLSTKAIDRLLLISDDEHIARHPRRRFPFFFQAEDGIRDRNVTGVQTCALPILDPIPLSTESVTASLCMDMTIIAAFYRKFRSEERRVGKEWRSRWSP